MKAESIPMAATAAGILSVRECRPEDAARWETFVERCPAATFFHRIGWREVLEDEFRHRTHYLIAERGTDVVGVLPLAQVKSRLFGHALTSLPFAVYGGPAADDAEAAERLVDAAESLGRDLGVEHVELRHRAPFRDDWPRQDLYVTYRKPILPDVEANMLAIPRKQRAMVRKAIGRGLAGEIDADTRRFFALYADNVHRHGTPAMSARYFERLRAVFGDAAEVLTVVDANGRPVSSVLSFYFRDEVLPYYAGDNVAARDLAANDFKYWRVMQRAADRGCTLFDFGRSKKGTGPYHFKKNWGFEPTQLVYEYLLLEREAIPQNNPLNPRYRLMIETWRRMPRAFVNWLGPRIVGGLG